MITTAYQNAKVISIANHHPVVFGSGKSLIGSRTETFIPETPHNGDIREIIVLSTPAVRRFLKHYIKKIINLK